MPGAGGSWRGAGRSLVTSRRRDHSVSRNRRVFAPAAWSARCRTKRATSRRNVSNESSNTCGRARTGSARRPWSGFVRLFYRRATAADPGGESGAGYLRRGPSVSGSSRNGGKPGAPKVPCPQSARGRARMAVLAYGRRDRQRRHAVPRRFDRRRLRPQGPRRPFGDPSIVRVRRDAEGRLLEIAAAEARPEATEFIDESHMHIEIGARSSPEALYEIAESIRRVLANVRRAVEDWRPMQAKVDAAIADLKANPPPVAAEETEEAISFLEWLADDHFTFLGYREYVHESMAERATHEAVAGSGLGVLRDPGFRVLADTRGGPTELSPEVRHFLGGPEPVILTKANIRSTVHRAVHMGLHRNQDLRRDGQGRRGAAGSSASSPPRPITSSPRGYPSSGARVRRTVEMSGLSAASHDGKALANILDTFPRDELFQISERQLHDTAVGVLDIHERSRIGGLPSTRSVRTLRLVPGLHPDEAARRRARRAPREGGRPSIQRLRIGVPSFTSGILRSRGSNTSSPPRRRRSRNPPARSSRSFSAPWREPGGEGLHDELLDRFGEERGDLLRRRYGTAFPAGYAETFSAREATFDIEKMEGRRTVRPRRHESVSGGRGARERSAVQALPSRRAVAAVGHASRTGKIWAFRVIEERPLRDPARGRRPGDLDPRLRSGGAIRHRTRFARRQGQARGGVRARLVRRDRKRRVSIVWSRGPGWNGGKSSSCERSAST